MANVETKADVIYGIDDIPPPAETVVLGLQHYLTMFGSTVAIPLILAEPLGIAGDAEKLGWLIGTMFFVSGIATILQTTWGNRLPIIQGGRSRSSPPRSRSAGWPRSPTPAST